MTSTGDVCILKNSTQLWSHSTMSFFLPINIYMLGAFAYPHHPHWATEFFFHLTIRHNEREGEREKEKARKNYFAAVIVGILLLVWWQLLNKNVRKNKKLRYFFVCWSYLSTVFHPPEHFIYKYICHMKKNVPQLLQFEIRSFSIDIFNSFFVRLSFGRSSFSVCHFLKMFS